MINSHWKLSLPGKQKRAQLVDTLKKIYYINLNQVLGRQTYQWLDISFLRSSLFLSLSAFTKVNFGSYTLALYVHFYFENVQYGPHALHFSFISFWNTKLFYLSLIGMKRNDMWHWENTWIEMITWANNRDQNSLFFLW